MCIRDRDYPGDVITASGVVTAIEERDGFGHVECRVNLSNQRGEETASGRAIVVLPKKDQSLPLVWEPQD